MTPVMSSTFHGLHGMECFYSSRKALHLKPRRPSPKSTSYQQAKAICNAASSDPCRSKSKLRSTAPVDLRQRNLNANCSEVEARRSFRNCLDLDYFSPRICRRGGTKQYMQGWKLKALKPNLPTWTAQKNRYAKMLQLLPATDIETARQDFVFT